MPTVYHERSASNSTTYFNVANFNKLIQNVLVMSDGHYYYYCFINFSFPKAMYILLIINTAKM